MTSPALVAVLFADSSLGANLLDESMAGPLRHVYPGSGLVLGAGVPVAHLRRELGQPHPNVPGVPPALNVQRLQDRRPHRVIDPPYDPHYPEPYHAYARD